MTPPKAQLRFDYQQSLLLGEVRSASPKKYMKKKLLLARHWNPWGNTDAPQEFYKRGGQKFTSHSKSSPQRANISFFSPIFLFFFAFFFDLMDFAEKEGLLVF